MSTENNSNGYNLGYSIGVVANKLGMHQRTIRIYDETDILKAKRNSKNRRYYTDEDIDKLFLIKFLTNNLALNLAGVKVFIATIEKHNIEHKNQMNYAEEIARIANIDKILQLENINKTKNRGRNKKNKEKESWLIWKHRAKELRKSDFN